MPLPRPSAPARWRLIFLLLAVSSVALVFAWPRQPLDPAPPTAEATAISPVAPTPPPSETRIAAEPIDPAATKSAAPKSLPSVTPHRASVSQRAADLQRLASETDLSAFAAELQARADAGDADAAAALADLLEGCASMAMIAAMDPQQMAEQWRNLAIFGFNDTEIASMRSATEESMRRCSAFSPRSDEAWRGLMTAARARAAALGHPGALLRQQRPRGPADSPAVLQADERARRAGVELLQQGEPMDLMRYAPHLASHSPYDTEGYLLAACTLLDGCMRDPRAYAMTIDQAQHLRGFGGSFFELSQMSPRQQLIAQAQSEEILRLWRARQFEQILSGRPTMNGMGGG